MPDINQMKQDVQNEIKKIPPTSDQNMIAALSYIWIVSLIMLVVKKNDDFVQFHAKQAIILFLLSLLGFIPVIGWIVWALAIAGMVVGFIQAWKGKRFELPLVYGWSKHINI